MAARKEARKLILLVLLILMPSEGAASGNCPYTQQLAGTKCSSEKIDCSPGQQAQIIDASFCNPTHENVSSGGCSLGVENPDILNYTQNGQCGQRLSFKDLRKLYTLCRTNCTLDTIRAQLSDQSMVFVEYICVTEQATIDPCTTMPSTKMNSSILLQSKTKSCYSTCLISPTGEHGNIRFGSNVLTDDTNTPITVQYMFEHRVKRKSAGRTSLHSPCYNHGFDELNVAKLSINFQLPDPARVSRLWIHFYDAGVNITCYDSTTTTPGFTASTQGFTSTQEPTPIQSLTTTHGSTTTAGSTSTHVTGPTKEDKKESADRTLIIACVAAAAAVLVVLGTVVVVFCIKRRRRGGKAAPKADDHGPLPSKSADPPAPHGDDGAHSECLMDDNPTSQRVATPRDMNMQPLMAARTGYDAGDEYGRLQRDGARVVVMTAGGNEVYDHVTTEEGVYNVLQRENKKREMVDNIYNTTSNL